jgi:hypothetical protein
MAARAVKCQPIFSARRRMLLKAWRGQERFWKVWWLWGVPIHAVWWTVYIDLWMSGLAPEPFLLLTVWFWPILAGVFAACSLLYLMWCFVAWRCAGNVERHIWTIVARVLIGVGLGSFLTECVLIVMAPFA